jgi:hypothetical protein
MSIYREERHMSLLLHPAGQILSQYTAVGTVGGWMAESSWRVLMNRVALWKQLNLK